jgi:negative regulator of flagellin synthesis FlgM
VTNTDATPASADSANVSSTTTLLAAITKAADSVPTIDETRVTALQQAIASGTFQPDSEQTAQKMIDMEGLLDGGKATA